MLGKGKPGFSTIYALILIPVIALLAFVLAIGPSIPVKTIVEPDKGPLYPTVEDMVLSACTASRASIELHVYNIYNRASYTTLFPTRYSVSIISNSYSSRLEGEMSSVPIYIPGSTRPDIDNTAILTIAFSGMRTNIITVYSYNSLFQASTALSLGSSKIWCNATRQSTTLIDDVIVDPYAYKAIIRINVTYTNLSFVATRLGRPHLPSSILGSCSLYLYTPTGGPFKTNYASLSVLENVPGFIRAEILLDLNQITKRYGRDIGLVMICVGDDETLDTAAVRVFIP